MRRQRFPEADVVIIGGGITGAAIARELSRYKVEVILLERSGDLSAGQSKATFGVVYTGLNMVGSLVLKSVILPPGTPLTALHDPNKLLEKWSEEGFKEWPQVFEELDIRYQYLPLLIMAINKDQIEDMQKYIDIGRSMGGIYADFEQLTREEILALEPNVNKDVITGLYAKDHVIDIFPPEVVIATAENASQNGAQILLSAEVTGISQKGEYQIVQTARGPMKTKFIVNAAGGWADRIADMGGPRDWSLQYRKSQLIILDRRSRGLVNGVVRLPNVPGRLAIIQPRDNNIMVNIGTYDPTDSPEDTDTIRRDVLSAMKIAKTMVPAISEKDIITSFGGVRVFNTRNVPDHLVEFMPNNQRFLNVVIRLPGFIGALPMARHVVTMLGDAGLELETKHNFNPYRKAIPRFGELTNDERNKLIAQNPKYGHVICRCETVTEGEIVEAIGRGARTVQGIQFRTRAGMGRCQRGFCGPRVLKILSRELGVPITEVPFKSPGSEFIKYRSKELLQE
jgi:glycerol-3-phosphate dehydrogenase